MDETVSFSTSNICEEVLSSMNGNKTKNRSQPKTPEETYNEGGSSPNCPQYLLSQDITIESYY